MRRGWIWQQTNYPATACAAKSVNNLMKTKRFSSTVIVHDARSLAASHTQQVSSSTRKNSSGTAARDPSAGLNWQRPDTLPHRFVKKCGSSLPWFTQSDRVYVTPAGSPDDTPPKNRCIVSIMPTGPHGMQISANWPGMMSCLLSSKGKQDIPITAFGGSLNRSTLHMR